VEESIAVSDATHHPPARLLDSAEADRSEADRSSAAEWELAAATVLKKSGTMDGAAAPSMVWSKLARRTTDGLLVPALGTPSSTQGLPGIGLPGHMPFVRGRDETRSRGGWDVRTHHSGPDAAACSADALTDLENGATSLWLTIGRDALSAAALGEALNGVYLDLAPVVLECHEAPVAAASSFLDVVQRAGTKPAPGTNLGADPLSCGSRGLASSSEAADVVARISELALTHRTLGFAVDATMVHDHGGSESQELGYATAAGLSYLRLLTDPAGPALDVDTAAGLLEFRFAATDEQFLTIAKLRAGRRLWARAAQLCGVGSSGRGQRQHAVTSRPMMTRYDPWVNMLRVSVAVFAAGVGGVDAITALPFDSAIGRSDQFGRRIARNVSSLLIYESHLAEVTDPAGGAYAVEQLTDELARAGWAELQRIEADGGVPTAWASLSLDRRIREVARRRSAEVAHRRRPITGVSEFPHIGEQPPTRRPQTNSGRRVRRYAAEFEALRDDPIGAPVFLATLGPIAAHSARAGFVANLMAAGGVATVTAGATDTIGSVLGAYQGQPVVCLAGTDHAYREWGEALIDALRSAGARYLVLAGRPGPATLPPEMVDDSCAAGRDAIAFLRRIREELRR
jgi:methylmalonyl-CoA mutase